MLPSTYRILSSILLLKLTPHVDELLGNISVDFEVISYRSHILLSSVNGEKMEVQWYSALGILRKLVTLSGEK